MAPATNQFVRLDNNDAKLSWTDGGLLLNLGDRQPWARLDPRTSELTRLTDYAPWTAPADAPFPTPRFVQVGQHIISANGQLFTPDGKQYRVKPDVVWSYLQRVGPGFITHYDEKARVLWYVEPKSAEQTGLKDRPAE
jgi:hypothetical protein